MDPGGTPHNGLYREAPPERGTLYKPQVHERVGISLVEVHERVGKSVISVDESPKGLANAFYCCENVEETFLVL